jgi:hypothetical protein
MNVATFIFSSQKSSAGACVAWLGNPLEIPQNSAIIPIPYLLNSRIFIGIFFPIIKCVPTNWEHVPAGLESSPAIDSSDVMNRKMFPLLFLRWRQLTLSNVEMAGQALSRCGQALSRCRCGGTGVE